MKTYIQFDAPSASFGAQAESGMKKILTKLSMSVLTRIIPKANPDFENKIAEVKTWLLECDDKDGIPEREIGLNAKEQVIVKMPFNENYGYWTDNNLTLKEFRQHFQVLEISEGFFEQKWAVLH